MQSRRFGAQFEHVAQNCYAAAAMGRFTHRKDLECGSNRSGTGVVALVDQRERAVRTCDTLLFAAPGRCTHPGRSEEHTSELQSVMRTSYAVFSLTTYTNDCNQTT